MMTLPRLSAHRSALFLDFDGTLADLALRPDAVVVPDELMGLLNALHQRLDGALALVTGRSQQDLATLLPQLPWPAAFEHGAMRRNARGMLSVVEPPDLSPALAAAQELASSHSDLLLERKTTSLALHYRLAPELEATCVATLRTAVSRHPSLQLLRGKAVVEVKSAHVGKGLAIEAFMQEQPFAGRQPLFAGDDVTDEAGFEVVQRLGGAGIKVGEGPTLAMHRCASPDALRSWLNESLQPSLTAE